MLEMSGNSPKGRLPAIAASSNWLITLVVVIALAACGAERETSASACGKVHPNVIDILNAGSAPAMSVQAPAFWKQSTMQENLYFIAARVAPSAKVGLWATNVRPTRVTEGPHWFIPVDRVAEDATPLIYPTAPRVPIQHDSQAAGTVECLGTLAVEASLGWRFLVK